MKILPDFASTIAFRGSRITPAHCRCEQAGWPALRRRLLSFALPDLCNDVLARSKKGEEFTLGISQVVADEFRAAVSAVICENIKMSHAGWRQWKTRGFLHLAQERLSRTYELPGRVADGFV